MVVLIYGGNLVSTGELTMGSLASFVLHSLQLNSSAEGAIVVEYIRTPQTKFILKTRAVDIVYRDGENL